MKKELWKKWIPIVFGIMLLAGNMTQGQEISPAQLPLDGGTWRFSNFSAEECGWTTFTTAFDLKWYDYINPVTYIMYGVGRYEMCDGHCYGMCLLINHIGEQDPSAVRIPYAGILEEPIYDNYPSLTGGLRNGIQVYHWRQFSTEVVSKGFDALFHTASEMRDQIDRDTRDEKFGIISIFHDGAGHVLVPYGVVGGVIYVYDPNRPRIAGMRDTRFTFLSPFRIEGEDGWSYEMAGGDTWTDSGGEMYYIPFEWSDDYKNLANGFIDAAVILLGENSQVKQITDSRGKTLYSNTGKKGKKQINMSKTGLGKDVFKFTMMSDNDGEYCDFEEDDQGSGKSELVKMMIKKYGTGYGPGSEIFYIKNKKLKNLKVETITKRAGGNVKMAVGNGHDFFELKVKGTTKAKLNPTIRVNDLSNLKSGVKILKTQVPATSQISYGKINRANKKLELQTINGLNMMEDSFQFKVSSEKQISVVATKKKGKKISVKRESINNRGVVNKLSPKQITIK